MVWKILLVEERTSHHQTLAEGLRSEGFEVSSAYDGKEAFAVIDGKGLPHLVVADVALPDMGGCQLAEEVTVRGAPVIVMADNSPKQAIECLKWAEDYVRKPANPRELAARIRRVLSRISDFGYAAGTVARIDDRVSFDYAGNLLIVDGRPRALTPIEARLLHTLLQQRGNSVDSRTILLRIWASEEAYEDTLRVHIHRLRRKLERDPRNPRYILTERGVGYLFRG